MSPSLEGVAEARLAFLEAGYEALCRAECRRQGIDPEAAISDGGHQAWQMVGHEAAQREHALQRAEATAAALTTEQRAAILGPVGIAPGSPRARLLAECGLARNGAWLAHGQTVRDILLAPEGASEASEPTVPRPR